MPAHPAPHPRRVPPDGRAKLHPPRVSRFLRPLHSLMSACQALGSWVMATTVVPRWLPGRWRHPLTGYLLALCINVGAASLTLLLVTLFPTFDLEEALLLAGIVLVALTCGVGPSLLATAVGITLLEFVLPASHAYEQHPADGVDVVVLLVSGISLSFLTGQSGWARRRAEALASSLRDVQESHDLERLRLRALLEALPVPVALVDAQERVLEFNPALQTFVGGAWRPRAVADFQRSKAWWPTTGQPVTPQTWPIVRAALTGERVTNEEIELETADGQRKIVLDSAIPIRDEHDVLQGAVGVFQDMTEHKRLEQALRQAEQDAAARARELEAIFEALTDGLLVYDAQGRILRSNQAARGLLGFEAHPEFASLPWQERAARYAPLDAQGQPIAPEDVAESRLLRGEVLSGSQAAEDCLQTPDGRAVVFRMTGRPLCDAEGAVIGAVGIARDETERRRMERQVAEHAAQLEAIFESIADGVVVTDQAGRVLRMNQANRAILGLEQDPTGWTLRELEARVGFASYTPAGQRLIEGEDPLPSILQGERLTNEQSLDAIIRTRAGRETHVNSTGAPIRDTAGQLLGAVFVSRDVTEQRRLEQQVAEHAAQLETIFESIADKIFVTDRQGRVLHMNQAYHTLLELDRDPRGWTFPQLEALAGFAAYTPAGTALLEGEDPITRVLRGEVLTNEQSVDILLCMRAGREVLLNLVGTPIRDATGQVLGSVLVGRDVTEQRRLEQQTRETLHALLAMAEALVEAPVPGAEALAEGAPEPNHVARRLAELTQRVLDCRYVGIAAVEPGTGKMTPITLVGVSPEHAQQWWASWDAHSRLGQHLQPGDVVALHAGEPVLVQSVQTPFPRGRDLVPGNPSMLVPMRMRDTLVGLLRVEGDTTEAAYRRPHRQMLISTVAQLGALVLERERLIASREEARASELALRETQAQMDTFLGMAGHELKTPLTSLQLSLQVDERRMRRLLQRETVEAPELAPYLDHLTLGMRQVERLDRLVNDLLEVSRVQAGKLDLHLEVTDLASIVREAVEEQRQAHPARMLVFPFPADRRVPLTADADRLGQVVTNYVTNALKYSPADRPVAVGLEVKEGQARVWVRDEGPGLPPEEQARIWDRFHRARGIEVQSGTGIGLGLGLYICRTMIERHQGQVGVESAPGQGSTFWFTLPLGRAGEEQLRRCPVC